MDTQAQAAVQMCGFDGTRRGNYFGGKLIRRTEVKARVGKLKNGKVSGKDEVTGEMIKRGGNRVVGWIWRLCNMTFEIIVVPEAWSSAGIVPHFHFFIFF